MTLTPRWIVFLIAVGSLAQEPAVFRSTTQLIQIDVAAEDKGGSSVTGLTKDDFELRVNGKPRGIDTLTAMSPIPVIAETLPRGTFSNRTQVSEVAQGRYTAFVLDCRNTNFTLQGFAIQELQKMLETSSPQGGKVALYLINNGFEIAQEFTSDLDLLKEKAAGLAAVIPPPVTDLAQAETAAKETVSAFRGLAKHLGGISGQKIVIWLSTGFPDNEPASPPPADSTVALTPVRDAPSTSFLADIDDAVSILGNANIVLESAEASYVGASVSPENGPVTTHVNPLRMIAERTGGRFFPAESSDLAATIHKAAADHMAGYEIGFYDDGGWLPGLIPIDVRVKRAGVALRYREGFYAEPAAPPATAQDFLERAVDAVTIPITAQVTRTAGNHGTLTLRLNVDAKALTLRQAGAVWRTKPTFFTRFASDVEDQVGDVPLDSPELALTQAQHDRALREGIHLRFTVNAKEGAVTLRVLVRDESSGAAGTVTIPLSGIPEAYQDARPDRTVEEILCLKSFSLRTATCASPPTESAGTRKSKPKRR